MVRNGIVEVQVMGYLGYSWAYLWTELDKRWDGAVLQQTQAEGGGGKGVGVGKLSPINYCLFWMTGGGLVPHASSNSL